MDLNNASLLQPHDSDGSEDHSDCNYSPMLHNQDDAVNKDMAGYGYPPSSSAILDSDSSPLGYQRLACVHNNGYMIDRSAYVQDSGLHGTQNPHAARTFSSSYIHNTDESTGCIMCDVPSMTQQLFASDEDVSPNYPGELPLLPTNTQDVPSGADPRNSSGIKLKAVSELPNRYRSVFKFSLFNAVQSFCMEKILHTRENLIISAPTGSGKTVLFELAIIRMLTQAGKEPCSMKCVYVAPTKALCSEKQREWSTKFGGLGVRSCELTGDTLAFGKGIWCDAKYAQIIVTTAEKWDSLTRNWADHSRILSQIRLFLVDEVHILNESRGSTLEVIVSRMKARGSAVRFLLVSATVPNIEDVASWIGSCDDRDHPATVFQFGEEFRPCKLRKFVYGIPRPKGQNDFVYGHTLDRHLFSLLRLHSQNKPILVFCPTRKGTLDTAKQLAADYEGAQNKLQSLPWSPPTHIGANFHDKDLGSLTAMGVAVHHAGLSLDDRKAVEDLYLEKKLHVLVATSTLAVGVNLPAHIVVIKGVKLYQNGETREYSDLEVLQMMGRAGRPQFDDEGIAIILCELELENKYRALAQGTTTIESSLHKNMAEHLNSEIGLGTIADVASAKNWLRCSFLFRRMQRNPQHYNLGKTENETWRDNIDEVVVQTIRNLHDTQLIMYNERDGTLSSTEYGDIMSKFYVRQTTMRSILELPATASIRQILEMLSSAEELVDFKLRGGERQMYEKIRQHNDIRFPIRKIGSTSDKIFLLVQAILGGLPLNSPEFKSLDGQPYLEAISVFRHLSRIAMAVVEVAIAKRCGAQVKHALELSRCLRAKAWEDHPLVLRQIEHIGERSAKVLAEHGINSIQMLTQTSPFRIEELLNRRPPFGSEVLVAAKEFPRYFLGVKEVAIAASHGNDPVEVKLSIECGLIPDSTASQKCKTSRRMGAEMTNLLTLTSDLIFIDFRRIATRALVDKKEFVLNVHLTKPSQTISVYSAPDKFAGLTVTTTYKPSIAPSMFPTVDTRPLTAVEWDLQGLEDTPDLWEINISDDERTCDAPSMDLTTEALDEDTHSLKIPTTSSQVQNIERLMERRPKVRSDGKYECNHPCKNKSKCRHYCCKEGLTEPPRSLKKKQGTRAEPFKVTASREKPPGKTYNPFTKRGSPRRRTNHVAHVARFRDSKSGSKQRADQPRRGPTPPCNQISTLRQALLPTKLNYPKSGNRTKVTPNFDLELTSLRSNSPVVESGPMVDDGLRMISEILKNERSPTPDTNYSNSEVDAMIRELPLDTDQQTVCKRDARHLDFEQHKRSSQSSHHMDYDNPVKRPKITQVRLSPYQEEKSTFPVSTPLAPKPSLFLSSPSDNGNEEFVQRLRDDADQPGGIASPSLPTHQSPAYNDDFYFDDTCSDLFSATISETPANVPYIEDQPRDTTRTRHTSPPRSCEPREEITAYGRAQATSDYLVATASKGSLELLPPSRISGFLSRQTLDADKSMCLSEWTEPRNCPRKGMPPVLGTPPVQQLTLDARTLVTLASVETSVPPTHPEDYTNVTRDDPLAEFDSWLASGAVDIVDIE